MPTDDMLAAILRAQAEILERLARIEAKLAERDLHDDVVDEAIEHYRHR